MDTLQLSTCAVDLRGLRVAHADGTTAVLSAREATVLAYLAERAGETVDRDTLYTEIWGYHEAVVSRAVDALVKRLRAKVESDPSDPVHVLTVHGEGYRFEAALPPPAVPVGGRIAVEVGRDPLDPADPAAVAAWLDAVTALAASAGATPIRAGRWALAEAVTAVRFCLAAVDAGGSVGARGAAAGAEPDGERVHRMRLAARPRSVVVDGALHAEVALAHGIRDRDWRRITGVRLTLDGPPERLAETGGDPAEPGLRGVAGNLVGPPNRTVGRSAARVATVERLRRARIVTITGAGGVGKTRLALDVGLAWRAAGGGAWFCDVSACRTEPEVEAAVARALELTVGGGPELVRAVGQLGGDLVVVDNAEQAVDAVRDAVTRWAAADGGPAWLVTSRERLGAPGEEVHELPPLAPEDAAALFADRCRALGVREGDPDDVDALVARLDGLPLAIELAAARSDVLPLAEIGLDRGPSGVGRDRGRVARHVDLAAVVRWSWDRLDARERRVLAACATFAAPFEVAAAVAVVGDPDEDAVVDELQALRRKSLLQRGDSGRLSLYATVRAFVSAETSAEDAGAMRDRHARWYGRRGSPEALDGIGRAGGLAVAADLRAELPDLLAAIDHAVPRDPAAAAGAFLAAASVLENFGPFGVIEPLAQKVLPCTLGRDAARVHMARAGASASAAVWREVDDALRAYDGDGRAVAARGEIALNSGDPRTALVLVDRAAALLRAAGDDTGVVRALWVRATALDRTGSGQEAGDTLVRLHALARRLGDRAVEADVACTLAVWAVRRGDLDRGLAEARAAAAADATPCARVSSLGTLARIHAGRDEPGDALRCATSGLAEARRIGWRRGAQRIVTHLVLLASEYHGADDARRWAAVAREAERDAGWPQDVLIEGWLGEVALASGRPAEALEKLGVAIDAMTAAAWSMFAAGFHRARAVARVVSGDLDGACADVDRAAERIEDHRLPTVHGERAVVRALRGDLDGARDSLAAADALVAPQHRLVAAKVDVCRALVALAAGDRAGAGALLARVRSEVDGRGLGPTTLLGWRLAEAERAVSAA